MSDFVLVTGASGGLGRAVCDRLAAEGYSVFACDLHTAAQEVPSVIPVELDVTDSASVAACVETVRAKTSCLRAVVNLAGIFRMGNMLESGDDELFQMLNINLLGMYRMNRALFSLLKPGSSRIINMSSEIGYYSPQPFNGLYSISKHAVDCYTDVLRRELMYLGVPVVKIQAGSFKTGMLTAAQSQFDVMIAGTAYYSSQLSALEYMMTNELKKGNSPELFAKVVAREIRRKKPHRRVRVKNSFKLRLLNRLPEGVQDIAYRIAIR